MAMDYRDAISHKEKPEKRGKFGAYRQRWWELEGAELAQAATDTGEALQNNASDRLAASLRYARLYENCDLETLDGSAYNGAITRQLMLNTGMMSLNVGASCVDTLTAKVTKNKPVARFLTSGASWVSQIKARALEQWMRGFFYQTQVHEKARSVFVDGLEFGTGFLQVFDRGDGKLDCERVLPTEIFVEDLDGQYGCPRQMVRLKNVSRDVLTRLFPEYSEQIADAGKREGPPETANATAEVAENTIQVWELWHLPSGPKAKDGKHVIAIDGCVLFEERWKIERFPFVKFMFKRRTTGFWGKGVIETVQPIQVELNRVVRSISLQMRRKGKGRTFVQIGSKVVPSHLTNEDGGDIVYYTGSAPTTPAQNAIAPEEFNYVIQLRQQAFQECGISELSAAAKKPAGLDAAVALREYSDIESERFAPQHQDWEKLFLDYANLAVDLITKQYGWSSYKVLVPGRRDLLEVDWASIDLDRDSYVMQMFPASSLPQNPGARYQRVKEMMADGFIEKPVAQRLLDFPDIEAESNLGNAILDDADATISAILDEDEPRLMPLEPYQNLDVIIQRANQAYLYARHRNCPEDRLTLLRNLIDSATAKKVEITAPPPAPMGPPGALPMATGAGPLPGAGPSMSAPPAMGGGTNITNTMNLPIQPTVPPVIS